MKSPRDEFDGPAGSRFLPAAGRLRLPALPGRITVALGVALLLVIVAVVAASYPRHHVVPDNAIPVVQADAAPYRVKPQDPGGMAIPYRDSTVFDALHNTEPAPPPAPEGQGKVENLLGVPEQPLPRDKIFPEQKTAAGTSPTEPSATVTEVKPQTASPPPLPSSSARPSATVSPSAPQATAIMPVKATPPVMDTPPAMAEPEIPAVPKVAMTAPDRPTAPAANADSYVQLGAVRSAEEASTTWAKAKVDDGAELSGLALHVGKVDLPKGTFYRVQGGPVPAAKARAICTALNARKTGSCLVARR